MSDLATLTKALVATGVVTTPPTDLVARRARRIQQRRVRTAAAGTLALVLLATASVRWAAHEGPPSHVRVVDRPTTTTATTDPGPTARFPGAGAAASPAPEPAAPTTTSTTARPLPRLSCRAGDNGGATDRGVTADTIRVTMTETLRFPERYTTVDAYDAVKTVFKLVNDKGGICGRLLDLELVNPVSGAAPWEPHSDAVAGIGGPLDENVDIAVANGTVDRSGTPLMAPGLTSEQFRSPWVWPVLPPSESLTRIAVDHAYREKGARTFAIVYEADRAFGVQAARAFADYVTALPDARVVHVQPLRTDDHNYNDEAAEYTAACGNDACDLVVLALEQAADRWTAHHVAEGRVATSVFSVARQSGIVQRCQGLPTRLGCDRLHVWQGASAASGTMATPFPVECHGTLARTALADSARIGACVLLQALRRVGPELTRANLRAALDELTAELSFLRVAPDGRRYFDIPARAYQPKLSTSLLFPQFRLEPVTGWLRDPAPW